MAGNQQGKSEAGAGETSMHLTGLYPEWWEGKRFDHPITCWVGSDTNETTFEICQEKLFGLEGELGTGFVPADCIGKITPSRNVSGAFYKVRVKHALGGWSTVVFKSYKQGRAKWQGVGVHFIWMDEEPPLDIWGESVARVTATDGCILLTFTPLTGATDVVNQFYEKPDSVEKNYVRMELDDVAHEDGRSHLTPEMKEKLLSRYPKHQRDARLKGLPILGSGLVYPVLPESLEERPPEMGEHWRHIVGLDMGGAESDTAWVWLALDPTTKVIHLIHSYAETDPRVSVHATAMVGVVGQDMPVAWPHDVAAKSKGDGSTYKQMYQKHGCNMIGESARFPKKLIRGKMADGGAHVEPGVQMILELMLSGLFKASRIHHKFYEELGQYHRQDGVINKGRDHTLDAIRYGIMMIRFAERFSGQKLPTRNTMRHDPLGHLGQVGRQKNKGFPTRVVH